MRDEIISLLKKKYPNAEVRLIGSGWTSDAFEAGDKIIRVPKTNLEQYEKEVVVLDFLQGRLPVQIPHPKVIKENSFAYAEHTKIKGDFWNISTFNALSEENQNLFAQDIAHFFAVLHAIPVDEIYKEIPKKLLEPYALDSLKQFREALKSEFAEQNITTLYKISKKILTVTSSSVLLHKDFWKANVLVDKKHRLSGVFDWANACIGNREWDFKALYHPVYFPLLDKVLAFYEKETGYRITRACIENLKIADSLLCVQYFIQNPQLKNSMTAEWQKSLASVKNAIIKMKSGNIM